MIHDFHKQLEVSISNEKILDPIYNTYFQNISGISKIERVTSMPRQRAGVDTIVTLNSGEHIVIQEKIRDRKFTGDFLIEYCSVYKNGMCDKHGWIYTIDSDYLFTVYKPSNIVIIYPVVQLKLAWKNNKERWIQKCNRFSETCSWHGKYKTYFSIVPTDDLEFEIKKVMKVSC